MTKNMGRVLWVSPGDTEFVAYGTEIRALRKEFRGANMDVISKVTCPKAGVKNRRLQKKLMGVYKTWLGKLSYNVKAHKLRWAKKTVQKTDWCPATITSPC